MAASHEAIIDPLVFDMVQHWHSNTKYRRVIWQCNNKFAGEQKCKTPHFAEDELKQQFVAAVNQLLANKAEAVGNLETMRESLFDAPPQKTACSPA